MVSRSREDLSPNESHIIDVDSSSPAGDSQNYFSQKDIELTKTTNEAPVWNILPSYHMYTTTIYKGFNVSDESLTEPPSYETSSIHSAGRLSSVSTARSNSVVAQASSVASTRETEDSNDNSQRLIIAYEDTNLWRETILDNVHKLTNLTYFNKEVSNAVKISIQFTKEVGELGKEPILIDSRLHEYKQGDLINGFVLITNESNEPIPFDMFYVLFEGNLTVANTLDVNDRKPSKVERFLQMFDFSASWNHAYINRLITEYANAYECPLITDSYDDTKMGFSNRKLLPGVTYKRFFTFKIPENLLDSECGHSLLDHTQIPPSLGKSRSEDYVNLTYKPDATKTKSLSFIDTSISYGVQARFIGRASKYNVNQSKKNDPVLINSKGDEYVILKETNRFLRIVPQVRYLTPNQKAIKRKGSQILYKNLINRCKEKIKIGHELIQSIEANKMDNAIDLINKLSSQAPSDHVKFNQLYQPTSGAECKRDLIDQFSEQNYNLISPYTKRSIRGSITPIGTLQVSTPKLEYILKYITPVEYRRGIDVDQSDLDTWNLRVPIELTFRIPQLLFGKKKKLPTIKTIQSDLVVLSIKSDKHPIPIEITHDLLFKNEVNAESALKDRGLLDLDDFSSIVKSQFNSYRKEIHKIFLQLPPEVFKLENLLVTDINCLSSLKEKHMNLQLEHLQYQVAGEDPESVNSKNLLNLNWTHQDSDPSAYDDATQLVYKCKFDLLLDIVTAHLKVLGTFKNNNAFDAFNLVPSFQSCYIDRFYYLKISINLSNGDTVHLKVPVDFEK